MLEGTQVSALLVEDDPLILMVHREMLELLNCQVEVAKNGRQAVEQLTNKNYDIIFLDMGLPDMGGPDVVKLLRQSKRHKDTPVIALTGYGRQEDTQLFSAVGVDKIMLKPVQIDDIRQVLQEYCPAAVEPS